MSDDESNIHNLLAHHVAKLSHGKTVEAEEYTKLYKAAAILASAVEHHVSLFQRDEKVRRVILSNISDRVSAVLQ